MNYRAICFRIKSKVHFQPTIRNLLYMTFIISKNNRNTHEYKYVYFSICLAFSLSIPDCDQATKVDRLNNDYK